MYDKDKLKLAHQSLCKYQARRLINAISNWCINENSIYMRYVKCILNIQNYCSLKAQGSQMWRQASNLEVMSACNNLNQQISLANNGDICVFPKWEISCSPGGKTVKCWVNYLTGRSVENNVLLLFQGMKAVKTEIDETALSRARLYRPPGKMLTMCHMWDYYCIVYTAVVGLTATSSVCGQWFS